jgi:hypothetical protein
VARDWLELNARDPIYRGPSIMEKHQATTILVAEIYWIAVVDLVRFVIPA